MRIDIVAYDHPDASRLVDAAQQDEADRYGDVDRTPVHAAEFAVPLGLFLVGYLGGTAVACGGWRVHGSDAAELKRLYVAPPARRRGC
ncbi:GNAT family N-acetyltransferase, partial [Streptomyces sp. 8N706]|uniref:GNAT family N-acetyltransferase n=1 Tax=Streptomyces sp. 8N706 TaxID=3457416 RepID=UPI003FD244E3